MKVRTLRGTGAGVSARLGLTVSLTAALALPAVAGFAPRGEGCSSSSRIADASVQMIPENYHARFDPDVAATMAKSGDSILRTELTESEIAAQTALAVRVPELQISRDDVSRAPVMVLSYRPGTFLAVPANKANSTPEGEARAFFRANKALWGMTDADLSTLRARYVTSPEGGATIVKFDQYVSGIQLFDTEIAVVMTSNNQIVCASGRMYGKVNAANGVASRFRLSQGDVIVSAVKDLTGRIVSATDFVKLTDDAGGGYAKFAFTPDRSTSNPKFFSEDTRIKPVLFPLASGQFVPAYYVEILTEGNPGGTGPWFSYVIDAESGKLLFRNNLTAHQTFQYRTYAESTGDLRPWDGPTGPIGTPHPTGTPDGYQAPFIAAPLVSVESLLGPTDPWLPAGATVTTGNNTDAYLDLANPNGFSGSDVRGAVTSPGVFDYQYDWTQNVNVAVNRQAAVVGMFYQVNWLHDFWYLRGFNELSGNAQTDNYGRGGVASDSLLAEGQDVSGTDNANMSTLADGGKPRMQMYTFNASNQLNPTRDGTFDMLIVGHEMGHYISNRLIGNSSGLGNRQGGSMGEGWGDFNCVLTTVLDTDNVDGTTYAVGGQTDRFFCGASFNDNYYYSIRRYPMSSSKAKNPLTFKDIGAGITTYPGVSGNPCLNLTSNPAEVHNSGEIWAQMLWQCFVGLSRAYGVSSARVKITQYMIDGMKATPSSPTFSEARDGVIAAANAANGNANPKDAQILWQAFAFRGIGTAAVSPARTSGTHAGVVQDFTAAPALPDDTVGFFTSGTFFERDVHFGGAADQVFSYGGGLTPIVGNWDGSTGVGPGSADTPGVYDTSTGFFFLKNSNGGGGADLVFGFGPGGVGAIPLVGDWDGNGSTTVGLYLPSTGSIFLRNSNSAGPADIIFNYGPGPSTLLPVVGDWDGNGTDTIGLYDPVSGFFLLKNSNAPGGADLIFGFGPGGDFVPLGGDWNSDGTDTVGIYSPSFGLFYLRNANSGGAADEAVSFGPTGVVPVAGNFDGM